MKTADTIRVDQIADSVGKEIELNPQNKRIRAYHYKNEKQEIYYFVNEDETVYSGEIRVPHLGSCYAYDAWNGIKMVQEYRTDDESTTILSMKLRSGESRIVVVAQEKELETQLEKSLFEMMYGVEKEKIPVKKNWEPVVRLIIRSSPISSQSQNLRIMERKRRNSRGSLPTEIRWRE